MGNGLDIQSQESTVATMSASHSSSSPALRRRLSLPLLSLYGIGVTIGAGIYVLVGKVAIGTGVHAPLSFLVAAILAAFTAFSYAELGGRVPKSAGEAMFVHAAFGKPALATAIGFLVMITGIISSGAIVIGFVGYLHEVIAVPSTLATVGVVALLATIVAWGIGESVMLAAILTVAEIVGLLLIIGAGMLKAPDIAAVLPEVVSPVGWNEGATILSGAVLAFFAFVGFEDIVNVAEEAKDPVRTVPRATIITLVVSSGLYFLVAVIAVAVVPLDQLGGSDAPLALVFETATGQSAALISLIAIFAVLNGVMIQLIMSSRILYGIAREGWIPRFVRQSSPGNTHADHRHIRRRRRGDPARSHLADRPPGRDDKLSGAHRVHRGQPRPDPDQAARSSADIRSLLRRSLGAGDGGGCQLRYSYLRPSAGLIHERKHQRTCFPQDRDLIPKIRQFSQGGLLSPARPKP